MIEIEKLCKTYHLGKTEVQALKGVDLRIERGDMVCVMGPSGSGKSTLLNILGCLDSFDSGSFKMDRTDVGQLDRNALAEIRAKKIGFIFQSFNLIPVLDVYENVELPLYIQPKKLKEGRTKERIERLLEEVGLQDFRKHRPDELSGGQRQRVAIARALVTEPEIVLADEPTANLDSQTAKNILELMKRLNVEDRVTFIFSTHDPSITPYASRLFRLKDGALVDSGS